MLLSVITTVYNGEKYIRDAINSVLSQSFKDFEFIIVNDGSNDNTASILTNFDDKRIKIITQDNVGAAKSRNKAITTATGKYIAILDSDDISLPNRFETQLAFLENNNEYIMVGANAIIIDEKGTSLYTSNLPTECAHIKKQLSVNNFYHSAVMFRRETFFATNGYDETIYNHFEDYFLWIEFSKIGKLHNLATPLIKHRLTPYSLTNKTASSFKIQEKLSYKKLNNLTISKTEIASLSSSNKVSVKKKKGIYYLKIANIYLTKNLNKKLALKNICKSLYFYPFNFAIIKQVILLLSPQKVIKRLKNNID